ncbi:MAG: four helix bundle protein [Candidatus Moranbacteria bacterium CG_4_10_14_3_um_filter_44_15]|nr:MAG: hypothetical protein AUK19_03315 [Candidatus Moranbacteria bacterium CG2_30_45_14]PIX90770.1 MAG: four helix bundle protein [Candidatus Moranbacteria bacterium CG_4_10_14_3_um_filter_44_15]PJA85185.1 MAG: four helix bundle protein [Candidatus Moranbacteria bacterium CG_4_9_14_3_um_filter_45_14]
MEVKQKIQSFTDLVTWQEGHKLVLDIYKSTKSFPKEEMFGLTNQIRRAVVSITSNIAEGFNRKSIKDKTHFYVMAHGSVAEVQNQLLIARDVQYLEKSEFSQIANQTVLVHKLLTGLIKSLSRS